MVGYNLNSATGTTPKGHNATEAQRHSRQRHRYNYLTARLCHYLLTVPNYMKAFCNYKTASAKASAYPDHFRL
jgi:hypothetical protein